MSEYISIYCLTCPRISEENGDTLKGPAELAVLSQMTRQRAEQIINQHLKSYGDSHRVTLDVLDSNNLKEGLARISL